MQRPKKLQLPISIWKTRSFRYSCACIYLVRRGRKRKSYVGLRIRNNIYNPSIILHNVIYYPAELFLCGRRNSVISPQTVGEAAHVCRVTDPRRQKYSPARLRTLVVPHRIISKCSRTILVKFHSCLRQYFRFLYRHSYRFQPPRTVYRPRLLFLVMYTQSALYVRARIDLQCVYVCRHCVHTGVE